MATGFKWQTFIEISDEWSYAQRVAITAELNRLEPLNLMQETLRDIPLVKTFDWHPTKVTIEPITEDTAKFGGGLAAFGYMASLRKIILPNDLRLNNTYSGIDEKQHRISLTRLLLHELQHSIDPEVALLTRNHVQKNCDLVGMSAEEFLDMAFDPSKAEELEKLAAANPSIMENASKLLTATLQTEQIVVSRVNPTMEYFFNEVPRSQYLDFDGKTLAFAPYKMVPTMANMNFETEQTLNVNQENNLPLQDLNALVSMSKKEVFDHLSGEEHKETRDAANIEITWLEKIQKEIHERSKQNFPNGNSRWF